MNKVIRATAILTSGSAVSVAAGLVSAKVTAVILGASGVGVSAVFQSYASLSGLVLGMGIGTGIVRIGAQSIRDGETNRAESLLSAAWLLYWVMMGLLIIAVSISLLGHGWTLMGPDAKWWWLLALMILVTETSASGVHGSVVNAHQKVGLLTRITVTSALSSGVAMVCGVLLFGVNGLIVGPTVAGIFTLAVAWRSSRILRSSRELVRIANAWTGIGELLRFGLPYTASMLVGTGVQMSVPILVLKFTSQADAGYYRAAFAITSTYMNFLISAMGQEYFPRISALRGNVKELGVAIRQQFELVMTIVTPAIAIVIIAAPILIPLAYSHAFAPSVGILRWQLIGDYFKFAAWTFSFVVLSESPPLLYFIIEITWGATNLAVNWVGLSHFGVQATGVSYMASYIVYAGVVWALLSRRISLQLGGQNWTRLILGLVLVVVVATLSHVGGRVSVGIAIFLICIASLGSIVHVRRLSRVTA